VARTPGAGADVAAARHVVQIRGQPIEQLVNPVLLDVGDGLLVDAGRATIGAHAVNQLAIFVANRHERDRRWDGGSSPANPPTVWA
jgi:hypothetical protein